MLFVQHTPIRLSIQVAKMSEQTQQPPKVYIAPQTKLALCRRAQAEPNLTKVELAVQFGITPASAHRILDESPKWLALQDGKHVPSGYVEGARYQALEWRLKSWTEKLTPQDKRSDHAAARFREEAKRLALQVGISPSYITDGWLNKMMKRHRIRRFASSSRPAITRAEISSESDRIRQRWAAEALRGHLESVRVYNDFMAACQQARTSHGVQSVAAPIQSPSISKQPIPTPTSSSDKQLPVRILSESSSVQSFPRAAPTMRSDTPPPPEVTPSTSAAIRLEVKVKEEEIEVVFLKELNPKGSSRLKPPPMSTQEQLVVVKRERSEEIVVSRCLPARDDNRPKKQRKLADFWTSSLRTG